MECVEDRERRHLVTGGKEVDVGETRVKERKREIISGLSTPTKCIAQGNSNNGDFLEMFVVFHDVIDV